MNICRIIKAWRKDAGIGVRDAAEIIGVSPSTLSRIENDLPPDTKSLAIIWAWMTKPVNFKEPISENNLSENERLLISAYRTDQGQSGKTVRLILGWIKEWKGEAND